MRLSRFNVYIPDFPDAGDTLIYNHLTGGMVPVTQEGMTLLRRIDAGEPATEAELAEVNELTDPDYGMLVPDAIEDERRFAARMDLMRKNKRHLTVTISTSLACNFGCTYCIQGQVMSGKTMGFETVYLTGKWLVERMRSEDVQSVELCFLGGEPLLHPHIIERISNHVRRACEADGREYSFNIVTNGYFLDRPMAQRLKDLGCTWAKVTLDGDASTHDKTRPLKGGKSSFRTIFDNLKEASRVLRILLQGNYSEATLPGFIPLLKSLRDEGFGTDQIATINFTPALGGLAAPIEMGTCKSPRMSEAMPQAILELADAVQAAGYKTKNDGVSAGPCGFHNRNHFAVDPEGYVYKCAGFLGMPRFALGTIEGQALGPLYERALSPALHQECGSCASRPSCAGGCVAAAWIDNGGPGELQCDKPYFQTVGVEAIRRKWRNEQPAATEVAA